MNLSVVPSLDVPFTGGNERLQLLSQVLILQSDGFIKLLEISPICLLQICFLLFDVELFINSRIFYDEIFYESDEDLAGYHANVGFEGTIWFKACISSKRTKETRQTLILLYF